MTEKDFILLPYPNTLEEGSVTWESPSNIALVKYWGKKKGQIPENPSISFTLSNCKTITTLSFSKKENTTKFEFDVYLDGEKKDAFKPKIQTFFKRIELYLPFLRDYHFVIETSNTFPHSSGIASSASGMSALALCLMEIEKENIMRSFNLQEIEDLDKNYFKQKASFLARLGSGSACRSIEGDLIVWGKHKEIKGSSDLFGIKYPYQVHDNFKNYQDTILLVDKGEKQVSSTIGHDLMHNHPFADKRFMQAHDNISKLIAIFKSGDLIEFIKTVESEALTLHAMMMTSMPYFVLMKPNTLEIINKIWQFRQNTGLHICFTLDAGANVHVLYPESESGKIFEFIKNELVAYCENGHYICDRIGFGANQLTMNN
ncbi:diphosphomevalonate/mevalonate 3,5-bisphosphate decarboxylase family protein [Yeosuana sp.]|uniref:diphosphomevalonate/mevalonate 3,5-bisphosphate decarboxylase family protein n=1 Tax=Yeosuana sp. TaxID=2529388 RepID=UPI004054A2F5|tara:strand:+ start:2207 stop:3325 length:1119 start_codon:yes stop_codon:yes gene_type:complete